MTGVSTPDCLRIMNNNMHVDERRHVCFRRSTPRRFRSARGANVKNKNIVCDKFNREALLYQFVKAHVR